MQHKPYQDISTVLENRERRQARKEKKQAKKARRREKRDKKTGIAGPVVGGAAIGAAAGGAVGSAAGGAKRAYDMSKNPDGKLAKAAKRASKSVSKATSGTDFMYDDMISKGEIPSNRRIAKDLKNKLKNDRGIKAYGRRASKLKHGGQWGKIGAAAGAATAAGVGTAIALRRRRKNKAKK